MVSKQELLEQMKKYVNQNSESLLQSFRSELFQHFYPDLP